MDNTIKAAMKGINKGDKVKFRVLTRDGHKTATRIVRVKFAEHVELRFWSLDNFIVRDYEIKEIFPKKIA
jgi:hypothetical protein